jgi:hypothetical protein
MYHDTRRNPNPALMTRRAKKSGTADLRRIADEFDKLKRFGAPEGGFAKATKPSVADLPPPPRTLASMMRKSSVRVGEKRRSELSLPIFVPPATPVPAPPPEPAVRHIGPAAARVVSVRNSTHLATALEQAKPGDHLMLADGDYLLPNRRFTLKGTAERPIALIAAGRNVNILAGNNPHSLQLDRCEHLLVNGLRFAPRLPHTARAINVTDGNFVTIAGCWIGEGAAAKDLAAVHFGADASGRYNNHNHVVGNVIYARGSAAVHFGPGGGQGARIVDNELRATGDDGQFQPLIAFTPGGMSAYRTVVVRGNRLIAEGAAGGGIWLNGVVGADISGNTLLLKRDAAGSAGALLEIRADATAGGQVTGLVMHHNELGYDRPGSEEARAAFIFGAPVQATFAHNSAGYLGARLIEGRFASMIDPALGLCASA